MAVLLDNKQGAREVYFRGRRLDEEIIDNITAIEIDMSTTQVTELTIVIEDPEFKFLKSGVFDVGTNINYRGLRLVISVLETSAGGGQGSITVRCRPLGVEKLKKLRGKFVMKNVTVGTYVKKECQRAGVKAVVQTGGEKKKQIARDVKQKGQKYDNTNFPSAWTTFQRLADEYGYLMYEIAGTVYFGKPKWLVRTQPKVQVQYNADNGKEPYSIPEFRQSNDNNDVELSVELPIERSGDVLPGHGIVVSGFPKFSGTYFITNVNYPLIGVGTVSVTASTVENPKPQKGGDEENGKGNSSSKGDTTNVQDGKKPSSVIGGLFGLP